MTRRVGDNVGEYLLSIIVPIYNVADYVQVCIESIVSQLTSSTELILVDDGSTDKSASIIDCYISNNVKVIHKKNDGVVSARLAGIQASQGQYLMFVDGDDWIEENCIDSILGCIKDNVNIDMICFGYKDATESIKRDHIINIAPGLYDELKIKEKIFPLAICNSKGESFPCSIWGKVYKKCIVEQGFVKDFGIAIGEDAASIPVCLVNSSRIYIMNQHFYCYRNNLDSATKRKKGFDQEGPILRKQYLQTKLQAYSDVYCQIDRQIVLAIYTVIKSHLKTEDINRLSTKDIRELLNREEYKTSIENAKFDLFTKAFIKKILLKTKLLTMIRIL